MNRIIAVVTALILSPVIAAAQDEKKPKVNPKKDFTVLKKLVQAGPDAFIKHFDKDKDGALSKEELPPFLAKGFEKLDANGDGKLDRQEVARMLEVLRQRLGDPKTAPNRNQQIDRVVDGLLKKFDANGDGKISKEEAKDRLAKAFPLMDKNKDGYLDRSELRALAERLLAKDGNPKGAPDEASKSLDFDALDANADGRLSREELRGTPLFEQFDRIDANGDGRIDRREFEAYLKTKAK